MASTVRPAGPDDVAAIAALSARHRRRLAGWAPTWWRIADGADDLHPLWLHHLITAGGAVARVAVDGADAVRAASITHDQGATWFVDDVVADGDDAGTAVLRAVTERPALTCVATADEVGARRATVAGWTRVSAYWIGPPAPAAAADAVASDPVAPEDRPRTDGPEDRPPHTFGPALAAGRVGGLPAPPIYDPGGTVTVVVALPTRDVTAALQSALAEAAARGDVLVALVVGADDSERQDAAATCGLVRTVDVWSAPG